MGVTVLPPSQVALLHSLSLLARHLACAGFSCRATRNVDAARCVAAAAIAAIADAVMRAPLTGAPSQVARPPQTICKTFTKPLPWFFAHAHADVRSRSSPSTSAALQPGPWSLSAWT